MSPLTYDKDRLTAKVAENIRMVRIRRDLSGRELAELIGGVSHTWVSNRETGDVSCSLRDITALAEALQVSEAELLGFEEQALVRSEVRDLDEALRDPRLPRAALDIVLGLVGQAVAVALMATPRRRALPPAPKEPKMTERKVTRRGR
jgi:transcriptional regulator with XRE-family HTH domain